MTGKLSYNYKNQRYGLLVMDLWEVDGFHCGEGIEVIIDGQWVKTRFEMTPRGDWYLVDTNYSGNLENITARIKG